MPILSTKMEESDEAQSQPSMVIVGLCVFTEVYSRTLPE